MWKKLGLGALAVAGAGALGHVLGSTPDAPEGGPLAPCPSVPNCARARVALDATPAATLDAAFVALAEVSGLTMGALAERTRTATGARAVYRLGPFRDRLAVAVEPDGDGSVLWVRSAASVGRSDLGVNARRARAVVRAVRARLPAERL